MTNILTIKRANAKKNKIASHENCLQTYEEKKENIEKLLKQIKVGLEAHDRRASRAAGGHHWGHVGDLDHFEKQLTEIRNQLMGTGEYQQ